MIVKQFNRYAIEIRSINEESHPDLEVFSRPDFMIYLLDGATHVGSIFFDEKFPVKPNKWTGSRIVLHFHLSLFDNIIKVLRYEKPLYVWVNDSEPLNNLLGGIRTFPEDEHPERSPTEPVGEEES